MQQLVADAVQLTGAAPPSLLDENAPVLASDELSPPQSDPLYFIGLIGGKDVGKSSLVNALVGRDISARTSFGPGTQDVIAYAHGARREEVRALLEAEVPARFRIVTHDNASLDRQVLLDLPDIDSHWSDHVQITRRILRHMLYPLWIASIEKYADQRPQKLLAEVAAGNDPRNFLFCLNKVDQLPAPDAGALRDDYARRIAGTLKLSEPPVVRLISALAPGAHDLPALRALLASQKAEESVTDARDLANRRRQRTLVAWLDAQNLPQRQAQARRLLDTAEELLADRVAQPILEQRLPRLQSDAGFRAWLLEPALNSRMSRWPIVNLIHGALSPLAALVRTNTGTT
ncbi:MAG: GTPase, partial [Tepidisphaeraceae bacterium]